ncbi:MULTISPECIES: GreA/GreB family elongation factor [unclassified Thiocapsa]|uniref:GreA/GreB family elongation factor n=1 Tax=unclassified Thiocapsa TaxID=2641286 RepID=UPI0035AE6276
MPVGSGLSQPTFGIVSQHAPLGGALLGATVGKIVEVHLPQGVDRVRIFDIRFPSADRRTGHGNYRTFRPSWRAWPRQ